MQWGFHRCFSTTVGDYEIGDPFPEDTDPEEWNPLPWQDGFESSTRFKSHWCGTLNTNAGMEQDPDKWLYDSDTKLLSLDAFPHWCLTMSPPPNYPENESMRYLFLAKCGDPSGHWAELEAAGIPGPYPTVYSQR